MVRSRTSCSEYLSDYVPANTSSAMVTQGGGKPGYLTVTSALFLAAIAIFPLSSFLANILVKFFAFLLTVSVVLRWMIFPQTAGSGGVFTNLTPDLLSPREQRNVGTEIPDFSPENQVDEIPYSIWLGLVRSVFGMGGVTSIPARIMRNWNVENRAFRAIDKPNRPAPPRYPTEKKMIARRAREHSLEESSAPVPGLETEKDSQLNTWLKQVKVNSHEVPLHQQAIEHDPRKHSSERALPQERAKNSDTEFGFHEPEKVMLGKVTLRQAMEIMSFWQEDPAQYTAARLAQMYKCRTEDITDLLRHFRVFMLYVPESKKTGDARTMSYSKAIFEGTPKKSQEEFVNTAPPSEIRAFNAGTNALRGRRMLEAELENEDRAAGDTGPTEGERRYAEIQKEQFEGASSDEKNKFPYKYGKPK